MMPVLVLTVVASYSTLSTLGVDALDKSWTKREVAKVSRLQLLLEKAFADPNLMEAERTGFVRVPFHNTRCQQYF